MARLHSWAERTEVLQVSTSHVDVRQSTTWCHDAFIVLCATQIMKGFEESKRGKGRGRTNFGLFRSCTGEEGFQELNLMCDWERSRVLSLNNIWTMLLNNFFANYVCRDGISKKTCPQSPPRLENNLETVKDGLKAILLNIKLFSSVWVFSSSLLIINCVHLNKFCI